MTTDTSPGGGYDVTGSGVLIKDRRGLKRLLLTGSTALLRLWFGLMSIAFALFLIYGAPTHWEYALVFRHAPSPVWASAFIASGLAMVHGACTSKHGWLHFALEGVVGVVVWSAMGILSTMSQGSIGGITIAGLINLFLFIRYPKWK